MNAYKTGQKIRTTFRVESDGDRPPVLFRRIFCTEREKDHFQVLSCGKWRHVHNWNCHTERTPDELRGIFHNEVR
jgi:hypothetical protein